MTESPAGHTREQRRRVVRAATWAAEGAPAPARGAAGRGLRSQPSGPPPFWASRLRRVQCDDAEDDLAAREADLAERERQAAMPPRDPDVLAALAKERDALADARDGVADEREVAAAERRERAAGRDVAASQRDRRSRRAHDDGDPGFPDRFMSGRDVDASAGDRADALGEERAAREDRQQSREDRQRASDDRDAAAADARDTAEAAAAEAAGLREGMESRTVIGQAQGLLMARLGITADEAFARLVRESQARNIKVREVARSLVEDAQNQLQTDRG